MKTYAFVLPLALLGCGFLSGPLDRDHKPTLAADDIARLGQRDGWGGSLSDGGAEIDGGRQENEAGRGAISEDGHIQEAEDGGHIEPGGDAAASDASVPPDATTMPPDAAEPTDAMQPAADAAADSGHDSGNPLPPDSRLCQFCTTDADCGPDTTCYAAKTTCIPRHPEGGLCADVCNGLFPTKHTGGIESCSNDNDLQAACTTALSTNACQN